MINLSDAFGKAVPTVNESDSFALSLYYHLNVDERHYYVHLMDSSSKTFLNLVTLGSNYLNAFAYNLVAGNHVYSTRPAIVSFCRFDDPATKVLGTKVLGLYWHNGCLMLEEREDQTSFLHLQINKETVSRFHLPEPDAVLSSSQE